MSPTPRRPRPAGMFSWLPGRDPLDSGDPAVPAASPPAPDPRPGWAYRLRTWPDLRQQERSAPLLRALSRMTLGPVTHRWFLLQSGLPEPQAEAFLRRLIDECCVELIDLWPPQEDTAC